MNLFTSLSLFVIFNLIAISYTQNSEPQSKSSDVVRCYICNEKEDKACASKPPATFIHECQEGEKYCRTIIQHVGPKKTTVRQCARTLYKDDPNGCYKTAGKATQHVCHCLGGPEPCNTGFSLRSSILAILLSVIIASLLFF